ncbi:MAG: hypothetical protein KJ048_11260 [Dehalococcoidia bacterium]|nr:hypothetical protein [Dehalococcoidia bacterium]
MHPTDEHDRASLRDRVYGQATATSEGRRSLLGSLFAVSVFLLVISLSVRQVTAPANVLGALQSGIAVVTDVNQLVADDAPRARELARNSDEQAFALPGYPLDIALSRAELLDLNDQQLTALLLQRSAALVYADGLGAFDRTGEQSFNRFSSQGLIELGVSQVSRSTHDRATFASVLFALTTAGFGALLAATAEGWGRLRGLGLATVVGALPGVLIFGALYWLVGRLGGTDPFESDIRDIAGPVFQVPLRNFIVVAVAGAAMTAGSLPFPLLDRRLTRPAAETSTTGQPGSDDLATDATPAD